MKDIILGTIGRNTIKILRVANGKIERQKAQIRLSYDSNTDKEEYSYFVESQRIRWIFAIISSHRIKPFKDKEKANEYFSSLIEKHNLIEVH